MPSRTARATKEPLDEMAGPAQSVLPAHTKARQAQLTAHGVQQANLVRLSAHCLLANAQHAKAARLGLSGAVAVAARKARVSIARQEPTKTVMEDGTVSPTKLL